MSLTNFLKDQDIKQEFARLFPKPEFRLDKEMLAPPRTKRYALVGTAFDYLLRFYLKRINPSAIERTWVAESLFTDPFSPIIENTFIDRNTGEVSFTETELTRKVRRIIDQAKVAQSNYLLSGNVTDEVLESALLLGQLDYIRRNNRIDENFGLVDKEDIADLKQLIAIVNAEMFTAKQVCVLNPTFGEGSKLVGGADADILIDDLLIDVKTTKNPQLNQDHFNQLIGYYVLYKIGGITDISYPLGIEKLGVYYSRHGELYIVPVHSIVDDQSLPSFIEWFKEKATDRFSRKRL
jgi:hypothetical protein